MGASSALILGDNIFYGSGFENLLAAASKQTEGATVFAYETSEPECFAIVGFDAQGQAVSLEEKPQHPKSNFAVTRLYFYDNQVVQYAKQLKPSSRGELEITDLNKMYLADKKLRVARLERSFACLDTGTHETLLQAANFVHSMQLNQGIEIACPEEIALQKGFITQAQLQKYIRRQTQKLVLSIRNAFAKEVIYPLG